MEAMTNRLLTAPEAAALLSMPESWVRSQARAGNIPHAKLGHYVRFDAAELEAWWRRYLRGPKTPARLSEVE